jgi:dipeptidyl aminopeptidase/acylaminoacyl peptidase
LNESLQADFEELERHKLGYMYVSSTDMSFQKWIIECVNDDRPVEYYVYDRSYKSLQLIALSNPHILAYQRAHTESIVFTARDGLKIHGYLTLPTAPSSRSHLPLVLLVHGGPWIRDCWGFDPRVQFFANRGYACLQINYRGSSGFGTAFVKASNKEYGRAMQHDLIDGAQWLIDQEIVDMHKIAICGRSFGGYAALAGATFTPDFYRCAISLYGKGNLINTKESVPPYWIPGLVVWKYRKGDPIIEEAMLKEQSPLFHLDNVHIPLLIAHGAHDARIKHTESEKIVELLRKRNIPCEYILFHNEGHGLNSTQSKCTFWGAVELFLAEHLGGRSETMI